MRLAAVVLLAKGSLNVSNYSSLGGLVRRCLLCTSKSQRRRFQLFQPRRAGETLNAFKLSMTVQVSNYSSLGGLVRRASIVLRRFYEQKFPTIPASEGW